MVPSQDSNLQPVNCMSNALSIAYRNLIHSLCVIGSLTKDSDHVAAGQCSLIGWWPVLKLLLRTPVTQVTSPSLDNIQVMVIVWRLRGNIIRLRGNIIRTALCWIVWHNVHSQQHTYVSSSYRSNRLGLSHWDPYAGHRGGCLELYYCNMVEWFWWDSSLISMTNWFPSVLWHCWFGQLACKNCPWNDL